MGHSAFTEREGVIVTEPKRTRLTDMEFDEISFVDNPAHPDAKVVLFKRHDPEVEKALHPGSHNSGPTSSDVHVDRPLGSEKRRKRKRKERKAEVDELMEKHRADHDEKTHGNRANARRTGAGRPTDKDAEFRRMARRGTRDSQAADSRNQRRKKAAKPGTLFLGADEGDEILREFNRKNRETGNAQQRRLDRENPGKPRKKKGLEPEPDRFGRKPGKGFKLPKNLKPVERLPFLVGKHAVHNQKDHGNWARGRSDVMETNQGLSKPVDTGATETNRERLERELQRR